MKQLEKLERENRLLSCLHGLPKKIISMHNEQQDNLAEFVLHDLCTSSCFDFNKAAYFVNNPDFNCLKGVAGICKHEQGFCSGIHDIWQQPDNFLAYMNGSTFNQKVRSIHHDSFQHNGKEKGVIQELAQELGLQHPEYMCWHMKHGNDGVLLFEHSKHNDQVLDHLIKEHLPETVYYLGLCPVH